MKWFSLSEFLQHNLNTLEEFSLFFAFLKASVFFSSSYYNGFFVSEDNKSIFEKKKWLFLNPFDKVALLKTKAFYFCNFYRKIWVVKIILKNFFSFVGDCLKLKIKNIYIPINYINYVNFANWSQLEQVDLFQSARWICCLSH